MKDLIVANPPCSRCGIADGDVTRADNGVARHETPMKCIAALKRALAEVKEGG